MSCEQKNQSWKPDWRVEKAKTSDYYWIM